jgi:hypothetical protein
MKPMAEGRDMLPDPEYHHARSRGVCPTCGVDVMRTAVVKLAYTMEPCSCSKAPYVHLTEQVWHRDHVGPKS